MSIIISNLFSILIINYCLVIENFGVLSISYSLPSFHNLFCYSCTILDVDNFDNNNYYF